eukprot:CAMPEP_0114502102 /NCGR_PEP_ID=MMETSP0109-20121206/8863_1 /TAXON_ID=29199 /ORGANISM="Chlorarachnion reptans, Strain CCCM449" /LENGTH=129 /DNA_ID=CAMNT_0001679897 /DNA_START=40 /DNA_END=429 /DNA_ORIENTATION=+
MTSAGARDAEQAALGRKSRRTHAPSRFPTPQVSGVAISFGLVPVGHDRGPHAPPPLLIPLCVSNMALRQLPQQSRRIARDPQIEPQVHRRAAGFAVLNHLAGHRLRDGEQLPMPAGAADAGGVGPKVLG